MRTEQDFNVALETKKVPILVLDQKWHRLFAIHGKTDAIKNLEGQVNQLLMKQGQLNTKLKDLKALKKRLMSNIMSNMDSEDQALSKNERDKNMEQDSRLIDEVNEQIEECEDQILELPKELDQANRALMLATMSYCYEKLRINQEQANEIEEWITNIRVELKKNIIKKQNREINNREIYSYMHDIFGHEILDLFDIHYMDEADASDEVEK